MDLRQTENLSLFQCLGQTTLFSDSPRHIYVHAVRRSDKLGVAFYFFNIQLDGCSI